MTKWNLINPEREEETSERTPKKFTDNLTAGKISDEMLENALYSVNKRAKNWRDKKREYRGYRYDKYHNFEKAEAEEKKMYGKKEKLLSLIPPVCIHKEFAGYERRRVYDYQKSYKEILLRELYNGSIVWFNSYIDHDRGYGGWYDDYGYYGGQEVFFFDYELPGEPNYRYYEYRIVGDHSFHTPITREQAKKSALPVFFIGELDTDGKDIADLASIQFVDKVVALVESGQYEYIGKYADPETIRSLLEKEKTKESALDKYERERSKENAYSLVSENWDYVSGQIGDYFDSYFCYFGKPYILTEEEKEKINNTVIPIVHSFVRKKYDSRKHPGAKGSEQKFESRVKNKHFFDDVKAEKIKVNREFCRKSVEYFSDDQDVTVRKLCELYKAEYPEQFDQYAREKSIKSAIRLYIGRMEADWKKEALSKLRR